MTNSISFNLQDTYEIGGLEEIVMYGKFYVTFRDMKGITYTSNIISELKSVPDSKGLVEFNIDDLVYSKEYQRYHELWYSNVYLSEGIKEPETNFFILGKLYNSSTQNFATKVFEISLNNIDDSPEDISRKGILGEMEYKNNLVLTSIENDLDISKMKETFKKVERDYLAAKEEYTTNLKNVSIDTSEIFERVAVHEPTAWLYVITRLLELNEGTIAPALRFTKNGGMDVEHKKLTMIQKTIENLLNMYPEIEIEDGEGMPYSNPKKRITDGEVKVENP
jgi:hypothetical protein